MTGFEDIKIIINDQKYSAQGRIRRQRDNKSIRIETIIAVDRENNDCSYLESLVPDEIIQIIDNHDMKYTGEYVYFGENNIQYIFSM